MTPTRDPEWGALDDGAPPAAAPSDGSGRATPATRTDGAVHVGVHNPRPAHRGRAHRGQGDPGHDHGHTAAGGPAPAQIVHEAATVPLSAFDTVAPRLRTADAGAADGPGPARHRRHLGSLRRLGVCPTARPSGGLVVALSRFGPSATWGTSSSVFEAFPGVAPSASTGQLQKPLHLVVGHRRIRPGLAPRCPGGFRLLHRPTALHRP